MLSHAEASATPRTLQPRPEVEGKHGSVPGRRLPRAATYDLAGPRPHLTRWGPTRGTKEPRKPPRVNHKQSEALRAQSVHRPPGRASPFRADAKGGGKRLGKEPREAAGARGLTLTEKPSSSTQQDGHGARPTRTPSQGCAGVTQESSQTPPTALYKATHSPASPLDPSALKEWLPARTCRRPPT